MELAGRQNDRSLRFVKKMSNFNYETGSASFAFKFNSVMKKKVHLGTVLLWASASMGKTWHLPGPGIRH